MVRFVAACLLFAMMCVTMVDVVGRYVFNEPFSGASELTQFIMIIALGFSLSLAEQKRAHITVDIVTQLLPRRVVFGFEIFNQLVVISLMVLVCWQTFEHFLVIRDSGSKGLSIPIAHYPFIFMLGVAFALFTVWVLVHLLQHLSRGPGGKR